MTLDAPELRALVELLDRSFGLEVLLVFGSEAGGVAHAGSDLDLAALFRTHPGPVALLEAQADAERLAGREVDLVDLDEASPILAMQVLRTGRAVFGGGSTRLAAFSATLPGRYEDLKRVRAAAEASLVDRVVRGRS